MFPTTKVALETQGGVATLDELTFAKQITNIIKIQELSRSVLAPLLNNYQLIPFSILSRS
jgi:hypothetical protein